MSDVTSDKLELSQTQTRNWVLIGALAGLLILVQLFLSYLLTTATTELRETNHGLVELVSTVKVQQVQMDYLREQLAQLQEAKKDATASHKAYDLRLNSIEQRLALHDQWIQEHNK